MESNKNVLMIGPDRLDKGGVATVVNQYYESKLIEEFSVDYIKTSISGGSFSKIVVFLWSVILVLLKINKANVVHIHMASRGSFKRKNVIAKICRLFSVPYIIHLHGAEFKMFFHDESSVKTKKKIVKIFEKAAAVIALSDEWKTFICQIAPNSNVHVIHNSVPVSKEKTSYDDNNILFLGRIGERKGVYDLIKALSSATNQDVKLFVGGDGDVEGARNIAKENDIAERVVFVGWADTAIKEELFTQCSMFALPSYNEGLPMSMLEAMSHGLAVIVSNVGGIPSVVTNNINGKVIRAGDVEAIKLAIDDLNNPLVKNKLGNNARDTIIEKYSLDHHVALLSDLYMSVCSFDLK